MDTLEVLVTTDPELRDRLVAELSEIGYHAFLESDGGLSAFVGAEHDDEVLRFRTRQVVHAAGVRGELQFRRIASRNWNEEWERSMQPVAVGRFVILPPWAEAPGGNQMPLWIEPKMSFGTGHHESTRLALKLVEDRVVTGNSVLDAGTGTGILAIAAARLGAERVVAFDVDPWSAVNCVENLERNAMSQHIQFVHGELADVSETGFDVAIANINRNVLLALLPGLIERVVAGGTIILSGLLTTDRDVMHGRVAQVGVRVGNEITEGEWWAAALDI